VLLKQDTDTPEDFQSGSTFSTNELNSSTDEMGEHVAGRKAPELRGVGETEHTDLAGNVLSQVPHDQHSSTGDTFQKSSTTSYKNERQPGKKARSVIPWLFLLHNIAVRRLRKLGP